MWVTTLKRMKKTTGIHFTFKNYIIKKIKHSFHGKCMLLNIKIGNGFRGINVTKLFKLLFLRLIYFVGHVLPSVHVNLYVKSMNNILL